MVKLSVLIPNKANPRTITRERFKALVKSVSEFEKMMPYRPIIIDRDGVIIAGNQRYKALLELDYKDVPETWVKKADDLSPEELRRFVVLDNEGFGETDWDTLHENYEAEELADWGILFEERKQETKSPKTVQLEPYKRTHVLLSFPPEKMVEIQQHLEAIVSHSFVEYEQSNN